MKYHIPLASIPTSAIRSSVTLAACRIASKKRVIGRRNLIYRRYAPVWLEFIQITSKMQGNTRMPCTKSDSSLETMRYNSTGLLGVAPHPLRYARAKRNVSYLLRLAQSIYVDTSANGHTDVIFKAPRIHDAQKEYPRGALGVGCGADSVNLPARASIACCIARYCADGNACLRKKLRHRRQPQRRRNLPIPRVRTKVKNSPLTCSSR